MEINGKDWEGVERVERRGKEWEIVEIMGNEWEGMGNEWEGIQRSGKE